MWDDFPLDQIVPRREALVEMMEGVQRVTEDPTPYRL